MTRLMLPVLLAAGLVGSVPHSGGAASSQAAGVAGLDHIPIAVDDLERAAERYRRLGFALKPGRPHSNGIRNQHVKFTDGTELELITAPVPTDALTTKYRSHLASGDGPAFLALYVPGTRTAPSRPDPPLDYLFFGPRNASPTDRPEHFAHSNTAESFVAVWLAADDIARERAVFESWGATISRRSVFVPDPTMAEVATFEDGEAILLPATHQRVPGRRIVGATIRVRNLARTRALLTSRDLDTRAAAEQERLFIPPAVAHGLWLEFRQR